MCPDIIPVCIREDNIAIGSTLLLGLVLIVRRWFVLRLLRLLRLLDFNFVIRSDFVLRLLSLRLLLGLDAFAGSILKEQCKLLLKGLNAHNKHINSSRHCISISSCCCCLEHTYINKNTIQFYLSITKNERFIIKK
ncbi:hypothetical protein [Chrysochromulina parva virus BQ2]|uniref:Uncharacterized protein n=1 Tax=Chrysochromulina parva virus BQ2 TaxID=3070831 RepID=A0A4Y6GRE2_9VIRU|nr:hypothetical protein QKE47_gp42 [Chrysochromulina parva virus]QDF45933.1 hypothetical protein [Chrysochromulina parva virus BQ2]